VITKGSLAGGNKVEVPLLPAETTTTIPVIDKL